MSDWKQLAKRGSVFAVLVLILSACAQPPPFGMSEAEWQGLSPQERRELLDLDAELDAQARDERELQIQAEERRRDRFCAYGVDAYCD
ncbi:MAG: hypothetical protein AAF414_14205 [Pseudomonadota bacterium]